MAEASKVVKGGIRKAITAFFEYDTPKIVHIRSKKVGIINRLLQIILLTYIIGYAIVWEKGYQEFDTVESAVTTKLKGVVYTNNASLDEKYRRVWDVSDYVVPPQENDAFFVMTNVVLTPKQKQGVCDEAPDIPDAHCESDSNCTEGRPIINGNGVCTGLCINSTQDPSQKVCQIHAWCPIEEDVMPIEGEGLLQDSANFTVLIKNSIEFPKFGLKRRNILETSNSTFLTGCHYQSDDEDFKYCPIFTLGTIVREAGESYEEIAVKGGVIAINIHWNCNLDFDISNCKPEYKFSRFDNKEAKIAKGWNFRYANYYQENNESFRDLTKAYGLRFIVKVTGEGGKFSIVPLLQNLGSGIALLAIATVVCDLVMLYVLKSGDYYESKKYLHVTGDDAFQGTLLQDSDSHNGSYDSNTQLHHRNSEG